MNKNISLELKDMQKKQAIIELKSCNEMTIKYGLTLSNEDINELVENRFKSLKDTGRIEFSEGVLKKLVEAFCDSPYIMQQNYKDILILSGMFHNYPIYCLSYYMNNSGFNIPKTIATCATTKKTEISL